MKFVQATILLLVLLLSGLGRSTAETASSDTGLAVQFRRPVAVAVMDNGQQLVIANQRSGTLSLVDLRENKVEREIPVGKRLSDLVGTADPQRLLVTDEEAHELLAVGVSATECRVEKRLSVRPFPESVKVSNDGTKAFVASLWSRTITVVDLNAWLADPEDRSRDHVREIRLPFSPREMLVLNVADQKTRLPGVTEPPMKLVVADAFGPRLAVIDPESGQVESVRELPAHAIRGLRLHPTKPQLFISHQLLSRLAQSSFDDVHWGSLMVNVLRSVDLSDVLDPKADLLRHSLLEYLGGPDRGAGDPAGFVMSPDGITGIAISGTDEFLVQSDNHVYGGRVPTEHYPTAVAISPDGKQAFVVNTLSDSVTIVKLAGPLAVGTISLGPQPEMSEADRGERLFHSAKLSHDGWISCASCHVNGHTNGLLNDNKTDGTFGTAKRVLSLRGVADTGPYAWNGRFKTLAEQIAHSVESTMQGSALEVDQVTDLEAYLKALPPPPAAGSDDQMAIERGSALFASLNCRNCHSSPAYTSSKVVDVGIADERGESRFNPPSLRGVSQNSPYFHDGRAPNLETLFKQFRHQLDRDLSDEEVGDLIAFLNNL